MNHCTFFSKRNISILIFESICSAWALIQITGLHAMNLMAFLFLTLCAVFFITSKKIYHTAFPATVKRPRKISITGGILFTFLYLLGNYQFILKELSNSFFRLCILIITGTGLFLLFYYMFLFSISMLKLLPFKDPPVKNRIIKYLPGLCFLLCVLCRIPYFLYSYPGILTPDSINQFEQVLGLQPYSNHHPWMHTLTISLFYHIGTLFTDNTNLAFSFYTIFQICFMSFAVSFFIWVMSKYTQSLILLTGSILFYALMPYHNVMAICIWKDILFSGSMLLFCSALLYLLKEKGNKVSPFVLTVYGLSAFLICVYRSNGWYTFLLTLPFLLIVFRKQKRIMFTAHFAVILSVLLIKGPLMNHFNVTQPDFVESISIPLQQVSRVLVEDKEITPEQYKEITSVIDPTYIKDLYVEYFADNIKELVRAGHPDYLQTHKADFFKLWLELGLKYPKTYMDAYSAQTYGYYSPSASYTVADVEGVTENATGLYPEPLIGGKFIIKVREILNKLYTVIPFYGAFSNMGSLLWMILICLFLILGLQPDSCPVTNVIQESVIWIPNIALIATLLLATPVATEFRYAYSLAYCLPLYILNCILFNDGRTISKKDFIK